MEAVRLIQQLSTVEWRYRRRMEHAKLETACLAHVDENYYYGAYCRKCKHHARLSLIKLRERLGGDFPVRDIRNKLRCDQCGDRRQIVVTFLAPNQRTGNLVHLFDREPRR